MAGQPGQKSTLPRELPDDYRLTGLPRLDRRSRVAKNLVKRQEAFAQDPVRVLQEDLQDCYHGLTLWRLDKEGKLRVRTTSVEAEKVYLGLANAWLGVYGRVVAQVLNGQSQGQSFDLDAELKKQEHLG